jgi:hypothetical protein
MFDLMNYKKIIKNYKFNVDFGLTKNSDVIKCIIFFESYKETKNKIKIKPILFMYLIAFFFH